MSIGLAVLRVVVGLLMVGHGTQKLLGWFGGHGLEGTGGFFGHLGLRPSRPMAALAGLTEAVAGALFALGLLTPLAAAGLIGVMVVAGVAVHAPNGFWVTENGPEYNLVLSTVAAAVAFTGPGRFSLDHALGWDLSGGAWALPAIAAGLIGGGLILAVRQSDPASEPLADEQQQNEPARAA